MNTKSKAYRIGAIVVANLIPVAGVILFDWMMFEVAMTYLLETFVLFFVFQFDRAFIFKKTRMPIPFALVQTFFLLPILCGFVYAYSILCFVITAPKELRGKNMPERMERFLFTEEMLWVLIALFLFESLTYALKNSSGRDHKTSTNFYHIKRILLVHFFIIGGVFIFALFNSTSIFPICFLIAFKVLLDFVIEHEKVIAKTETLFSSNSDAESESE